MACKSWNLAWSAHAESLSKTAFSSSEAPPMRKIADLFPRMGSKEAGRHPVCGRDLEGPALQVGIDDAPVLFGGEHGFHRRIAELGQAKAAAEALLKVIASAPFPSKRGKGPQRSMGCPP
jgi:hypothetical protein